MKVCLFVIAWGNGYGEFKPSSSLSALSSGFASLAAMQYLTQCITSLTSQSHFSNVTSTLMSALGDPSHFALVNLDAALQVVQSRAFLCLHMLCHLMRMLRHVMTEVIAPCASDTCESYYEN